MGNMYKLGWLIGSVKYPKVDSLYFLYLLLRRISNS
jgi:hypothetical protein